MILLDLTKTFDTVDHPLLINTLLSSGIGCKATKLFDPVIVTQGVPQGSFWDPCYLEFTLTIFVISSNSKYHLYVCR